MTCRAVGLLGVFGGGAALRVFVLLLIVGLLASHLPLSALGSSGEIDGSRTVRTDQALSCCAPPRPQSDSRAQEGSSSVSQVDQEVPAPEPCCPNGCHDCARSCCSAPLAFMPRLGALTKPVLATPKVDIQLAEYVSAAARDVYHPPRG